ncbi:fe2+ zn2+ uptake regulation protein [Pseudomonas sp. SMN5]|uniref:fe2+ zn2+ uptake regulation protein n=1 Tax=Pseudomonas sp. SMN5 TaxID=3390198 RepID=UPI003F83BACB
MNNPGTPSLNANRPAGATTGQLAFDPERTPNEPIRRLLRFYGLRTSLIRFKVINALVVATLEGRAIGVRGVYGYVQVSSADLSFIGVREVLKRLCEEGLIVFQADKSYRFTADAWARLTHELAD